LTENAIAGGFSQYGGNGFSNEGNMEHNTPMFTEEEDCDTEEDELSEAEKAIDAMLEEFPDLTGDGEVTKADILKGRGVELDEEELVGGQKKLDVNKNGKLDSEDFKGLRPAEKEYLTDTTRKQTEEIIDRNNNVGKLYFNGVKYNDANLVKIASKIEYEKEEYSVFNKGLYPSNSVI
jgi:hypothetical protein